jgi:hypothetical protein
MQGDDLFAKGDRGRHNSSLFRLSGDDPDDFWNNLDERHRQHAQHLRILFGAVALIGLLGVVIHPGFLYFAAVLAIPATVELAMLRTTRSRTKIPDHRPRPPIEVELDGPPPVEPMGPED